MILYKNLNRVALIMLFTCVAMSANAQKQPQVQEGSVRAPANIKIDGLVKERANPYLNAYNSGSRFYYVVSNDDNNLYLTLRGLGTLAAQKALTGGITFTISHAADRRAAIKSTGNVSITFPTPQDPQTVDLVTGPLFSLANYLNDTVKNKTQIDSVMSLANTRIGTALKQIFVIGIKEITDTVVSVYNTEGIKVAAQFIKRQPVIEIAIPLKFLALSVDNPVNFSYNIKLPGPPEKAGKAADLEKQIEITDPNQLYFNSANDFWGTYTLARRQ